MEADWVVIARFSDDIACHIAVDRLMCNDIEAVSIDKRDSVYRIYGEIELCVHRDNVIAAKELIKDLLGE